MDHSQNIASYVKPSDTLNPCICPACGIRFGSEAATNRHLSQSRKCAWYHKGKIPDLTHYIDEEDYDEDLPNSDQDDTPPILDEYQDFEEHSDDEPVLTTILSSSQPPSPKRARIESEGENDSSGTVEDIYPSAGTVIGQEATIQQKWHEALKNPDLADTNIFNPFESELDWKMVDWLINDGPSQSGNDRLLKIQNVCINTLLFI